jgi:hypothetical protein
MDSGPFRVCTTASDFRLDDFIFAEFGDKKFLNRFAITLRIQVVRLFIYEFLSKIIKLNVYIYIVHREIDSPKLSITKNSKRVY